MVCRRLRARPARYAGRTRMMSAPRCASGSRFNASNTARRVGTHMDMRKPGAASMQAPAPSAHLHRRSCSASGCFMYTEQL